jgi:hypothetical protein
VVRINESKSSASLPLRGQRRAWNMVAAAADSRDAFASSSSSSSASSSSGFGGFGGGGGGDGGDGFGFGSSSSSGVTARQDDHDDADGAGAGASVPPATSRIDPDAAARLSSFGEYSRELRYWLPFDYFSDLLAALDARSFPPQLPEDAEPTDAMRLARQLQSRLLAALRVHVMF